MINHKSTKTLLSAVAIVFFALNLTVDARAQNVLPVPYITGMSQPVGIYHAGDDRLFIVQQGGLIRIIENDAIVSQPFLNLSTQISFGGERGLLGLAFHPDYADNGYFYLNYTVQGTGHTRISRFQVSSSNPNEADPASELILMTINQPYSNHNGGHIEFGPDGYLYIGMGDGGAGGDPQNYSQTASSMLGKMLRIDVNQGSLYGIPPDNPFIGNSNVLDEIWAFGLRNPWKFSFDRLNGDLWIGDVGQNAWEEINYTPAGTPGGLNYGWRCYEGNANYNLSGCQAASNYTFPVQVYANNASNGCSVTGGVVYRGNKFSALYGNYLYADYCSGKIWMLSPDGSGGFTNMQVGTGPTFNITAFGEDLCGEIYMAGRGNGTIYRLEETTVCEPIAIVSANSTFICDGSLVLSAGCNDDDLSFTWFFNGNTIPDESSNSLSIAEPGFYQVEVNRNNCTALSDSFEVNLVEAEILTQPDAFYCSEPDEWIIYEPEVMPAGGVFTIQGEEIDFPFYPGSLGEGEYWLVYSFNVDAACTVTDSVLLLVIDDCINSTNTLEGIHELQLYPNPADNGSNLVFESDNFKSIEIKVMQLDGKQIASYSMDAITGKNNFYLSATELNGIYLVRIKAGLQSTFLQWSVVK